MANGRGWNWNYISALKIAATQTVTTGVEQVQQAQQRSGSCGRIYHILAWILEEVAGRFGLRTFRSHYYYWILLLDCCFIMFILGAG
jgi:hypothetical protein